MSAQERRPTQHHSQSTSCLLCHYGQYTESESRGNNTELGQTFWKQTVFVAWGIATSNEVTIPTRPIFKKQILTLAMSSPFPSLSNRLKQQHRSSPQSRCSRMNSCNILWQTFSLLRAMGGVRAHWTAWRSPHRSTSATGAVAVSASTVIFTRMNSKNQAKLWFWVIQKVVESLPHAGFWTWTNKKLELAY